MAHRTETKDIDLSMDCVVCSRRKKERDPRALSCKHTFCFECIEQMHKLDICHEDEIKCPICWEPTKLNKNGVNGLPVDEVVGRYELLLHKGRELRLCHGCQAQGEVKQASVRCCTCERRLCQECLAFHKDTSVFPDHKIVEELCKVHLGVLTHVCFTCCRGICTDCLLSKLHKGHDVTVLDDSGVRMANMLQAPKQLLNDGMKELHLYIATSTSQAAEKLARHNKQRMDLIQSEKAKLESAIETSIEQSSAIYKNAVENAHAIHHQAIQKAANALNENEVLVNEKVGVILGKLMTRTVENFNTVKELRHACQSCQTAAPDLFLDYCAATVDHSIGSFQFRLDVGRFEQSLGAAVTNASLAMKEKPQKQHLQDIDVKTPRNLATLQDGSCVVADGSYNYCVRINAQGQILARLYTMDTGKVCSVAARENDIFIASKSGKSVTVVLGSTFRSITLRPRVKDINAIDTDGEFLLLLDTQGLLKYSAQGDFKSVIAKGVFRKLTVVGDGSERMYLVSDAGERSLKVYKPDGNLIMCLCECGHGNSFGSVDGTTVLPNGHILVADGENSRICEFDASGSFVKLVLEDPDLRHPRSLAFHAPYLWVARSNGPPLLYKYS